MKEKTEEEHKQVYERLNNINTLKKQEEDYNQMKKNTRNMDKIKNSLILSESAKSTHGESKNKYEQIKQFENLERNMKKQMQQVSKQATMNKELENLNNINRMISNGKKEIVAKKISSSSKSEKSSTAESKYDRNKSDSESESESEKSVSTTTTSKSKKNNEDCSVSVASSNSYILKRPDLTKMLGKQTSKNEATSKESQVESSAKKKKK